MIDRKKGPIIQSDFDLELRGVSQMKLSNGLEAYEINSGTQNIIKIELVFKIGRIHEQQRAVAKAAMALLREGSTRHSSEELAELYDYYGAVVKTNTGMEASSVSLVVVERYFAMIWPVWLHMIFYPLYEAEELEKYKQVTASKFKNELAKNDVQGYRKLTEELFGSEHPYGYNTEVEDIERLDTSALLDYYNKNFGLDKAFVVISGCYGEHARKTILQDLGKKKRTSEARPALFSASPTVEPQYKLNTDNKVQVSIKQGRLLFGRKHPDYHSVNFLNMILGGYFGSRLMKNIREEKGYTYGIYSAVHSWKESGFFYISAEVANEYMDSTLKEIRREMEILQEELVPEAELENVRNYLLGQTLHLLDGPFAKGELMRSLLSQDLTVSDYEKNVIHAQNVTATEIQEMARKYLDPKDYMTVLVGGF